VTAAGCRVGSASSGAEAREADAPVAAARPIRRALVVDGDGGWRALIATVLEAEGFTIVEAETGRQAIKLAGLDRPALVVLEASLPDVSGYQVCRVLRGRFGDNLPIIFVSGIRTDSLDRLAGLRAGADDYLVKPLEPAKLVGRVERAFRRADPRASAKSADGGASVPTDALLPQLAELTERETAARALAEVYEEPVDVLEVAVVRHRPGQRSTLRYDLVRSTAAQPERIYAKTYASDRAAERAHLAFTSIAATDAIRVPEPIGWLPRLNLVLQARMEGKSATARLLAGDQGLAARIADTAFALHTSAAKLDSAHGRRHELAGLDKRLDRLPPALAARAQAHRAAAAAALVPLRWHRRPVHRDFHEGQILVDAAGRLGVLDLDDAALSEPAVDVARFLARLRLVGLKKRRLSAGVAAAARVFRTRYMSLDPGLDARLVYALEATMLLRQACIELERGSPRVEALIDLSGAVLEEVA
jgi:DNA-binding response OmpR family regulator/aminoglycoside phosphotransferase (APT) family kinase protein